MPVYPVFLPYAGCPHRCRFCRQPVGEPPDPGVLARSLGDGLPHPGPWEVAFYGGTFTLLPVPQQERYLAAVAPWLAAGRVSGIRISTRPDALEEAAVRRLQAAGVTTVEMGCQSFSAEVLARAGRGHGPAAAAEAVALLRRYGLRVGLQLMPGLPGGDRGEAVASLQSALGLQPDFLRIYPAVVFRDTLLETDWREGRYRPPSLEEAVDWCAELLWRCRRAGIPVVRVGLQDEPDLAATVAAGPWHPAFGQLVRSRLWRRALMAAGRQTGDLEAAVSPIDLSDALGHRKENLTALRQQFGHFNITPRADQPRGFLGIGGRQFDFWPLAGYGGT